MKLTTKLAWLVASTCLSAEGQAQNFSCRANPAQYLAINASGIVYTHVDSVGVLGICSMGTQMGSIHPDACKGWYSTLLTYKSLGRFAWIYFNPSSQINAGKGSCSSFAQWETREPYHLESG